VEEKKATMKNRRGAQYIVFIFDPEIMELRIILPGEL
jgi:hypothetical protein